MSEDPRSLVGGEPFVSRPSITQAAPSLALTSWSTTRARKSDSKQNEETLPTRLPIQMNVHGGGGQAKLWSKGWAVLPILPRSEWQPCNSKLGIRIRDPNKDFSGKERRTPKHEAMLLSSK